MAFTRPPRVQGGGKQEIRAEHHNALCRCIEELQNVLAQPASNNPKRVLGSATNLQFQVFVRKDGSTYKAKVYSGWVVSKNPSTTPDPSEIIKYTMPKIGLVRLDASNPPEIEVEDGSMVFLRIGTDKKGIVTSAKIAVGASVLDPITGEITVSDESVHYQPPIDGESGNDGDLKLWLARIAIDEDENVTIRQFQQGGPIEVVPNLPEFENIGGGKKVLKDRDAENDKWRIRTLVENQSETPQIKLIQEDEYIEVKGNGVEVDLTSARKVNLTVRDGLVVSGSYDDSPDADGWWGDVLFTSGGGKVWGGMTFANGILKEVVSEDSAPETGTELSPGNAIIIVDDG